MIYTTQYEHRLQQPPAPAHEIRAVCALHSPAIYQIARRVGISVEVAALIAQLAGIGPQEGAR